MAFVYGTDSLPYPKTDKNPLPVGDNPTQYVSAADWNAVCAAVADAKNAILAGTLFGFTTQGARPSVSGASKFLWVRTSDGHLLYYNGSTDTDLSAGGGGGTLLTAYAAGAAGPQALALDSTRLGLELDGYASMSTPLLILKQGATPSAGAYYFKAVDSAAVTHAYMDTGGLLWLDAINGGLTLDTGNAGSTIYAANIMQNNTAASGGVPVQNPPAFQWNGNVWSTTGPANKTMSALMALAGTSGASPFSELYINLSGSLTTSGKALTLSTGSTTNATTGLALLSANSAAPTLFTLGSQTHKSSLAGGATPAIVFNASDSGWNTFDAITLQANSSNILGVGPYSTGTQLNFYNGATQNGFFRVYGTAFTVFTNGNPITPFLNNTIGLGALGSAWKGVFNAGPQSCGYNSQTGTTYTATVNDCTIVMTNSAARTVTLPAANAVPSGGMFMIWDGAGTAGTANVSVAPNGADTIDGANATKAVVTAAWAHSTCVSDGVSKWFCGVNN